MRIKVSVSVACFSVLATIGGCAYGEARQVVRSQFAAELNCPEVALESRKSFDEGYKEGQFVARGCGTTRTYTCPADAGLIDYSDTNACTFVPGDMTVPKEAPKPQASLDDEGGGSMDDSAPAAEEPAPKPAKPAAAKGTVKASPFKASGNFKVGK